MINHVSWWKEELPSEEEYETARANLEKHDWKADYIISHCCPTSVQDELSGGFYKADALTDFLDEITRRCQFKYHFFGHCHTNRVIQEKYALLCEQIIRFHKVCTFTSPLFFHIILAIKRRGFCLSSFQK